MVEKCDVIQLFFIWLCPNFDKVLQNTFMIVDDRVVQYK
jgi:hypothetical protein